jgi:UrcA family protein
MTRIFTAFAALASVTVLAAPAFAQRTAEVAYSDLDLSNADGAATLKARVQRAAKSVCASDGDRSLSNVAQSRACSTVAMAKAMPQVELALAKAGTQYADAGRLTVAAK